MLKTLLIIKREIYNGLWDLSFGNSQLQLFLINKFSDKSRILKNKDKSSLVKIVIRMFFYNKYINNNTNTADRKPL